MLEKRLFNLKTKCDVECIFEEYNNYKPTNSNSNHEHKSEKKHIVLAVDELDQPSGKTKLNTFWFYSSYRHLFSKKRNIHFHVAVSTKRDETHTRCITLIIYI